MLGEAEASSSSSSFNSALSMELMHCRSASNKEMCQGNKY